MAIDTFNKQLTIMESDIAWEPGVVSVSAAFTTQEQFALIWSYVESASPAPVTVTRGVSRAICRGLRRGV